MEVPWVSVEEGDRAAQILVSLVEGTFAYIRLSDTYAGASAARHKTQNPLD
jgi:hypothetical protein